MRVAEEYDTRRFDKNTVIAYFGESNPVYLRIQDNVPENEYSWLEIAKNEISLKEDEFETICPSIAWGIEAYLLFLVHKDSKGRILFKKNQKVILKKELFSIYYEQSKNRYTVFNQEDYEYYSSIESIDTFDEKFLNFHIEQEKSLIEKGGSHVLTKLYDITNISKEYIRWVAELTPAINSTQGSYQEELINLFKGKTYLIDELKGLSDDEIAKRIKNFAKRTDKNGSSFIENPDNNLKSSFAKELKKAGIINLSERSFRSKL